MSQTKSTSYDCIESILPVDPEAYPQNIPQALDDRQQQRTPVFGYDMMNMLPTRRGQASFFGPNIFPGQSPIPDDTYEVFSFQDTLGNTHVIGLGENGIWAQRGDDMGTISEPIITSGEFETAAYEEGDD